MSRKYSELIDRFYIVIYFTSVLLLYLLFIHPVVSDSLQPHGLQHARPPCLSSSPEVCPSSHPLYRWCHPTISSSDALFSFCPQSFPAESPRDLSIELTVHIRWSKYWSFSFSLSSSNEYSGLVSLKIDCFDLLVVQETLRSLPQHKCEGTRSLALCLLLFYVYINFPYGSSSKEFASNAEKMEMWVQFLGQEDLLEEEMAIHFSILVWKIPWTEEPGWLRNMGSQRVRHNWSDFAHMQEQWSIMEEWILRKPVG